MHGGTQFVRDVRQKLPVLRAGLFRRLGASALEFAVLLLQLALFAQVLHIGEHETLIVLGKGMRLHLHRDHFAVLGVMLALETHGLLVEQFIPQLAPQGFVEVRIDVPDRHPQHFRARIT